VVGQQVDKQFGDAIDKLDRLRERSDVSRHTRVTAAEFLELRNVIRIWKKTYVEHKVAVGRDSVAKTEAVNVDQNLLRVLRVLKFVRNQAPKLMNVQLGCVNAKICQSANRS